MKSFFISLIGIFLLLFTVISCQKEQSFETRLSSGSLQSDSTGDCLPSSIYGIYMADSALTDSNYIEAEISVTMPGAYSISTDTINGFYFKGEGEVNTVGISVVHLIGHGTPAAAGNYTFQLTYGTTTCAKEVTVIAGSTGTTTSEYTFTNTDSTCPDVSFKGLYSAGIALDATNTLEFDVNVTKEGTYAFNITTNDGISFTGGGTFAGTGIQHIVLNGSGTPQTEGDVNVTIETCNYTLSVVPNNTPDAVFTIDCGTAQLSGIYMAESAMSSLNTVSISATVTTAGKYTLSTTEVNGVTFTGSGVFTAASTTPQTITLTAGGTPTASGPFTFPVSGNGVSCTFPVTFEAAPAAAVFTLSGAPDACASPTVNGTYATGTALTTLNTVVVSVDVTSPGSYTLITDAVNGMQFIATGLFTATGQQNVTLQGTGTPTEGGTSTFTPQIGSSSCTFGVSVTSVPVDAGTYTCKIDGVFTAFNDRAIAENGPDLVGKIMLTMDGFTAPADGTTLPELLLSIQYLDGRTITPGTYNVDGLTGIDGYTIGVTYTYVDANKDVTLFFTGSSILTPNPPFTITVTSLTSTRVKGTFSGKVTNTLQGSTLTKTITEGAFDLPIR